MSAFIIYQGRVTDPERYEQYKPMASESIAAAGGRFLVRGGDVEALEGEEPPGRTVLVEFPSRQAAIDWYYGEAYTAARAVRQKAAEATMYLVDGIAPEPAG